MFRTVRFALLAAPLLLVGCADKNAKTDPRAEEYSYTPTPTGRSTDTTTGTGSAHTPGTTDTGSTYTTSTYTPPSNPSPAPVTPTATYTPPPANSGGDTYGSSSTTMRVAEEPLSPAKSRSRSSGSAGGKTYTVKKGDTLGGIAQKHYGSASKWERIYNANKAKVSDPKKLKVGTKLIIP